MQGREVQLPQLKLLEEHVYALQTNFVLAFPFLSSACSGRAVFLNNARQVLFRFWWISVFSLCSIYAEVKEIALQVTGNILKKPTAALCKEQPPQMLKLQSYQCSFVEWLLAASPSAFGSLGHPRCLFHWAVQGFFKGLVHATLQSAQHGTARAAVWWKADF